MRNSRKILSVFLAVICTVCFAACSGDTTIKPKTPDGNYATQTRLSSLEYSIYMNKQITVFASQIHARMLAAHNADGTYYSDEAKLTKKSIEILENAKDEVEVTYPSEGRDDDRETTLDAMDTAINDLKNYEAVVEEKKDASDYEDIFENDFNVLTSLATLYYE